MSELKEPSIPPVREDMSVPLGGTAVRCKIVDTPSITSSFLQVDVMDPTNRDEVTQGIQDSALKKFWFLDEGIKDETLLERFGVVLDTGVEVDVYNFQPDKLSEEKLKQISGTLGKYYDRLKDKSVWNLDSIQIRSQDRSNFKSGQPFRGAEYPEQRRFELYPASFEQGTYRNALNCTWLEGAIVHETTHIVLEERLRNLWEEHREELGWESLPPLTLVLLPGGLETTRANRKFRELPTEYATFQEDDDRAESVVANLFDASKLNPVRQTLLSSVFGSSDIPREPEVKYKATEIPQLTTLDVYPTSIAGFFNRVRPSNPGTPLTPRVISLEAYRQSL